MQLNDAFGWWRKLKQRLQLILPEHEGRSTSMEDKWLQKFSRSTIQLETPISSPSFGLVFVQSLSSLPKWFAIWAVFSHYWAMVANGKSRHCRQYLYFYICSVPYCSFSGLMCRSLFFPSLPANPRHSNTSLTPERFLSRTPVGKYWRTPLGE